MLSSIFRPLINAWAMIWQELFLCNNHRMCNFGSDLYVDICKCDHPFSSLCREYKLFSRLKNQYHSRKLSFFVSENPLKDWVEF